MRDLLVVGAILASLPFCFRKPFIGILVWCIISYANPHRYTWGFANLFPVAMLVGVVTILGWFFSAERGRLPHQRETYIMFGLWAIFVLTTLFAIYPEDARPMLKKVSKILLMTFLTIYVVNTRKKFEIFIMILVLSIEIIGVKGGIWGVLTGAQYRLWGPEDSTLGDNNDVALALNMVSPMLVAFAKLYKNKWIRFFSFIILGLSLFAVILTQSRGGFLGMLAIVFGMTWQSSKRYLLIGTIIILMPTIFALLPEHYRNRMKTIETYDQDESAMARIITWGVAFKLAQDKPLTGGGFNCFSNEVFQAYAPDYKGSHASHSSYMGILGEHGFPALLLFIALIFSTFWKLSRLQRISKLFPGMQWVQHYASALQLGLLGYAVSGTFLGRAYFDLFYHFIAAAIILQELFHCEVLRVVAPNQNIRENEAMVNLAK